MFQLVSKLYFLQNLISRFIAQVIPPFLVHNLGKYFALKKAFYLVDLEELEGDYIEFGVFTGASMSCALFCSRASRVNKRLKRKFVGFDSFDGFGELSEEDTHPFYTNLNFKTDYDGVQKRLNSISKSDPYSEVRLVKGYFSDSFEGKTFNDYGVEKIAIVLIDNDTYSGAVTCFEAIENKLQEGSILILDDYFSYKGSEEKGIRRAFNEWKEYSKFKTRRVSEYGMGGVVYIVSGVK